MSSLSQRFTYLPRFLRHFWHRRKAGYSFAHAFKSTRHRMLEPDA
jgi:hypothetical protein